MSTSFNSQPLPGVITAIQRPVVARLRQSEVVRGGSYSQGGQISAKRIVIKGLVKGIVSLAQQAAALDDLYARLPVGFLAPLALNGEAGRAYRAEVESVTDTLDPRKYVLEYEVSFSVPSGSSEATSDTLASFPASGGTLTLSAGNERVRPTWAVALANVSSGATVTLANAATSEVNTFAPTDSSTRYLDSDAEKIYISGGTDKTAEWQLGDFLTLVPGANPLMFTASNCTVSSVSVTYRPRWR